MSQTLKNYSSPVAIDNWYVASVQAPEVRFNPINGHRYQGWTPCIEWCEKTYGEISMDNFVWRFIGEGVFEFKHEKDRTFFLLRWA